MPHNQAFHHDRGRILVSRDTTPLQRPRRVNCCVRRRVWQPPYSGGHRSPIHV